MSLEKLNTQLKEAAKAYQFSLNEINNCRQLLAKAESAYSDTNSQQESLIEDARENLRRASVAALKNQERYNGCSDALTREHRYLRLEQEQRNLTHGWR